MEFEWKGVFPALTTQFTENDELDFEMLALNIRAQLDAGVHGLVLGGSLGEASSLLQEEKEELLRFVMELVNGKVPVIMNIAEQTTRAAIEAARKAEKGGADGLMLLPPMRYYADSRETLAFFREVAQSTPLPLMIYNNPVDYKILVTLDMFGELARLSNIKAVKESTRDLTNITRMINRFGDRFRLFCGVDTLAMESLLLGADGWVAGLVDAYPRETVVLYELAKAGRLEEARKLNRWFMPLLELDIHPKLVQYIKLAGAVAGIGSEAVRPPRLPLEGEERERILGIVHQANEIRPVLPSDVPLNGNPLSKEA